MASLQSIGKSPVTGRGVQNVQQGNDQLDSAATSRDSVDGRVITLAGTKATKQYVDDRDGVGPDGSAYTNPTYVANQDNLYLPTTAKGVNGGVALLNANGRVPVEICPTLGSGFIKGPWGHDAVYANSSNNGYKAKIADWGNYPGVTAQKVQFLVFASVFVKSTLGRPVVEVRLGGPANADNYGAQILIARGIGTQYYDDWQVVTVQPCADAEQFTTGRIPMGAVGGTTWYIDSNFDARLTMWLYDEVGTSSITDPSYVPVSSAWAIKVAT